MNRRSYIFYLFAGDAIIVHYIAETMPLLILHYTCVSITHRYNENRGYEYLSRYDVKWHYRITV